MRATAKRAVFWTSPLDTAAHLIQRILMEQHACFPAVRLVFDPLCALHVISPPLGSRDRPLLYLYAKIQRLSILFYGKRRFRRARRLPVPAPAGSPLQGLLHVNVWAAASFASIRLFKDRLPIAPTVPASTPVHDPIVKARAACGFVQMFVAQRLHAFRFLFFVHVRFLLP